MKCPYNEKIQCAYLELNVGCYKCEHYTLWLQNGWSQQISIKTSSKASVKPLTRIIFVILVLLNVIILFIPNMIYWVFKGKDFLSERLNKLYDKWILKN